MCDEIKMATEIGNKPLPMKIFSILESDKIPYNCVPRLCSVTLTKLGLLKDFVSNVPSIVIALEMQGTKRTLRSNEIHLPSEGSAEILLQLHFALQYPHFLKGSGNKLVVKLEKRRKHKYRNVSSYKTLAAGVVDMAEALQKQMDLELCLFSEDAGQQIGKLFVNSLNSRAMDCDELPRPVVGRYPSAPTVRDLEVSGKDTTSSSEPALDDSNLGMGTIKKQQSNRIKQKFIGLVRKFRGRRLGRRRRSLAQGDIDVGNLSDELDLSDSDAGTDMSSVQSMAKPKLKPFFSSEQSLSDEISVENGIHLPSPSWNQQGKLPRHPYYF